VAVPLALTGRVQAVNKLATGEQRLLLDVETVGLPGERPQPADRLVSLALTEGAKWTSGRAVRVVTEPVALDATSQLAKPGTLVVARIVSL